MVHFVSSKFKAPEFTFDSDPARFSSRAWDAQAALLDSERVSTSGSARFVFQLTGFNRKERVTPKHRSARRGVRATAPIAPLASIGLSTSSLGTRALFDEIDKNRDGILSEAELLEFTSKRSLPVQYVQEFIRCVAEDKSGKGAPTGVRFHEFAKYVTTKEKALRESFDQIDIDRDGFISVEDLDAALEKVKICKQFKCPIKACLGLKHSETRIGHVKRSQVTCMMKALDVRDAETGVVMSHVKKMGCDGQQRTSVSLMDYPKFRNFFILLPDTALLFDYWMDSTCTTFRGCDIGCSVQMSNKQQPIKSGAPEALRHLTAGAAAGAVSRTFTAPMETLRLRMMVAGSSSGGLRESLGNLIKDARLTKGRAMFNGNAANVARSAPQKGIDFFAFSFYKSSLKSLFGKGNESLQILSAGALAGATSCVVLYPLEIARSRLTTGSQKYSGVVDCIRKIQAKEGVRGLYAGLKPSVLGILPEAAIAYGCFDLLKNTYARVANIPSSEVGATPAMVCGMVSAFTGQLVAYPLEVIARRMQVGDIVLSKGGGTFLSAAVSVARKEGVKSLYCGIVPASFKVLPMAAVSFGTYELVSSLINQLLEAQAKQQEADEADLQSLAPCRSDL